MKVILAVAAVAVAALISAVVTGAVRRLALARAFVDQPGGHKGHAAPVALGGGIAVVLAIILPIAAGAIAAWVFASDCPGWFPSKLSPHLDGIVSKLPVALGIIAAATAMCGLGLIDDRRPLGPAVKLVGQFVIAGFLVTVLDLRVLAHLPWPVSGTLSILWILILTNSLNFLDNMDGLATGVAIIAAAIFGIAAMHAGQLFVPVCCWLLVGALAGFLPYNFHPASVFLGDAGSLVIGMLLGVFTILTTFADPAQGQQPIGLIAPLVVMAVPLYDTLSVVLIRWRSGDPIWTGDRRHFSHRLVRRGMGARTAVLVVWLATLVTALPALLLPKADWTLAGGIMAQTLLVVLLVALLESSGTPE